MARNNSSGSKLSDSIKAMLHKQITEQGWTAERIAYEMQKLGQNISAPNLSSLARGGSGYQRAITVDEAVALLAIFRHRARAITAESERLTAILTAHEGQK